MDFFGIYRFASSLFAGTPKYKPHLDTEFMWLLLFLLFHPISKEIIQLKEFPLEVVVTKTGESKLLSVNGHLPEITNSNGFDERTNLYILCQSEDNDCTFNWHGFAFNKGEIIPTGHETRLPIKSWSDREITAESKIPGTTATYESLTLLIGDLVSEKEHQRVYKATVVMVTDFSSNNSKQPRRVEPGVWVIK
jgi:hypothetical protein